MAQARDPRNRRATPSIGPTLPGCFRCSATRKSPALRSVGLIHFLGSDKHRLARVSTSRRVPPASATARQISTPVNEPSRGSPESPARAHITEPSGKRRGGLSRRAGTDIPQPLPGWSKTGRERGVWVTFPVIRWPLAPLSPLRRRPRRAMVRCLTFPTFQREWEANHAATAKGWNRLLQDSG